MDAANEVKCIVQMHMELETYPWDTQLVLVSHMDVFDGDL